MSTTEKKTNLSFPSETETIITRTFNAPRELVFDCFTNCEHLQKWWGWGMTDCHMDLRPGGEWRRTTKSPDGSDVVFKGVYKEIVRPEFLSYTMIMGDAPELLETVLFSEENGQTKISTIAKWPSKEMLQGAAPYMEKGAGMAYDKLDDLLKTLQ